MLRRDEAATCVRRRSARIEGSGENATRAEGANKTRLNGAWSTKNPHVNLHQSRMIRMKMTAPNGAYCRSIAWMLIFRAALRYFSDSLRREDERCDIPRWHDTLRTMDPLKREGTYGLASLLSKAAPPCS